MVYKRYIERGGKKYGPYYYESYRDENGIPQMRKVDKPLKKPFGISLTFAILFLLVGFSVLTLGLVTNSDKSINSLLIDVGNFGQVVANTVGKIIEVIPEETAPVEESAPEETSEESTGEVVEETAEGINEEIAEEAEIIEEATETEEEIIEESEEINVTEEVNVTIEINVTSENITIVNETNVTIEINQTNITLENETLENITIINETLEEVNFTTEISTTHYGARLGEPVRWKKKIVLCSQLIQFHLANH